MGSFHGTCGLSQTPIKGGEKAVLFFLKYQGYSQPGGGGFCYSTDQYAPIAPSIRGVYNDYGSLENIDQNTTSQLVLEFFQSHWGNIFSLNEKELERCKHFNDPIYPSNLEELCNLVAKGCLNDISFMMVQEELFDSVVLEMGNRRCISTAHNTREKTLMRALEALEKYREMDKLTAQGETGALFAEMNKLTLTHSLFGNEFEDEAKFFVEALLTQEDDKLLTSMLDFVMFKGVMSLTRKLFIPQAGSGDSSNELYFHKMIGEFCIRKEILLREKSKNEEASKELFLS